MDYVRILTAPVALALVALVAYLVGRGKKRHHENDLTQARRDLKRAQTVARQLETITEQVRRSLAAHHASVARFKDRVYQLSGDDKEQGWEQLCAEAEEMLKPTLRLADQIAGAYDEIRQQSSELFTFTEQGRDPLTRIGNRKVLDEALESTFAMFHRYEQPFSVSIFDIDHFRQINEAQGNLQGDRILQNVARLIDESARDTDVVVRYGGEEFVVVMPHTELEGACIFSERLRSAVEDAVGVTVSGGVAQALDGDDAQSLIARADAALYGAKAAGRNCVYRHTGRDIECILEEEVAQTV